MYFHSVLTSTANVLIFSIFLKANSLLILKFGPAFRYNLLAPSGAKRISALIRFRELEFVLAQPNRLIIKQCNLSKDMMARQFLKGRTDFFGANVNSL